jgi:hypothetical protein
MRRHRLVAAIAASAVAATTLAMTSAAGAHGNDVPRADAARIKAATAKYHSIDAAEADDYTLLDVCFDDASGGMGYHYVKGIDGTLDPLAPEALVYEVKGNSTRLVAVEYIVPDAVSPTQPTTQILGQSLHHHPVLPLWVLHAWIWEPNPDGMFADFNPNVAQCAD